MIFGHWDIGIIQFNFSLEIFIAVTFENRLYPIRATLYCVLLEMIKS